MLDYSHLGYRNLLLVAALGACGLALGLAGCSETVNPGYVSSDLGATDGVTDVQPGSDSFVWRRLQQPVPGRAPIQVTLLGENLRVAAPDTVEIDVSVRNDGAAGLHAPAMIWLSALVPPGVAVLNADIVSELAGPTDAPPPEFGFDYSAVLGDDLVLAPGEISGAKTWRFSAPGLTPFSFRARAEFGLVPDLPRIAGLCFVDFNRDGVPQPDEAPIPPAVIGATGPDGFAMTAYADHDGRYTVPVSQPGLYLLQLWPRPGMMPGHGGHGAAGDDSTCDDDDGSVERFEYTTPNPLQVVLTPGPNGRPASFLDANFGVFFEEADDDSLPPVIRSPAPLDSLTTDFYHYLDGRVAGIAIELEVGYSGCQPEHPFALYWQLGPQMSPQPHVDLFLAHDGLGELCAAYFTRTLKFDLRPIREALGSTLPIYLHLRDATGVVHDFVLMAGGGEEEES